MKKIYLIAVIALFLGSCNQNPDQQTYQQPVQQYSTPVQPQQVQETVPVPGFNGPEFSNLLHTTTNPAAIENALNQPGNSINNVDANNDSQVDYLAVSNTGNQISVSDVSTNPTTNVATVNLVNNGGGAYTFNVIGNPAYCGSAYNTNFTLADAIILSWWLTPHPYYHSAWHYGYYPSSYVSNHRTVIRTRTVTRTVTPAPSTAVNRNAPSVNQRQSVADPQKSQRSFQVRDNTQGVTTTYGSKPASTSASPAKTYTSSRSTYGGSKSSFGGGRRK